MNKFVLSVCLTPALMTACLATGSQAAGPPTFSNSQPVIVTNPQGQGAHVFVDNPVTPASPGTPITIPLHWTGMTGTGLGGLNNPYTVPAGKQLLITGVSGGCSTLDTGVENVTISTMGGSNGQGFTVIIYLGVVPLIFDAQVYSYIYNVGAQNAVVPAGAVLNMIGSAGGAVYKGGNVGCSSNVFGLVQDAPA